MNDLLVKLQALYNLAIRVQHSWHSGIPSKEVEKLHGQFMTIREKLIQLRSDMFSDFTPYPIKNNLREGGKSYDKSVMTNICVDINYHTEILQGISDLNVPNLALTKEGIFFAGKHFDALTKISEIIETAKGEIILIDGYVNEKIIEFILAKNPVHQLTIITSKQSLSPVLQAFLTAAEKQFKTKITTIADPSFHDRFVLIDRSTVYHFGASLKDAGNKAFMFSVIEEEALKSALFQKLKSMGL